MSTPALFMVLTSPEPGREDEFEEWYERHQHEVVMMAGWTSARRYRLADVEAGEVGYRSLAVYEVDDIDLARTSLTRAREERDAAGNPPEAFLHSSDARRDDRQISWWAPVNDPIVAG